MEIETEVRMAAGTRDRPDRPAGEVAGAAEIGDVLERLATWVRRVTPQHEWNMVALSTLSSVCRNGPQRLGDLAAAQAISQPGMTGLITRMAEAGLLRREPDPHDGRAIRVAPTPAGEAYLEQVHQTRAALIAEQVRKLDPSRRRSLESAVGALNDLADLFSRPEGAR